MSDSFDFEPNNNNDPIAKVMSGKYKNENIYLNDNSQNKRRIESDRIEQFYHYVNEQRLRVSQKTLERLLDYIENDTLPEDDRYKNIIIDFNKSLKSNNEIVFKDGELQILHCGNEEGKRDVIFIASSACSGKTHFIIEYCKQFNKMYKKSPIYLFSTKPISDEKGYSNVKNINQVSMSVESLKDILGENDEDMEDEEHNSPYLHFVHKSGQSLVVFDDVEGCSKKQEDMIHIILNSVLQVGRSKRVYCIISKHLLNDGRKTRIQWSESNKVVLFPNGLSSYNLKYAMGHYLNLEKKQMEKILLTKFRWVCICTRSPRYAITQNSVYLL